MTAAELVKLFVMVHALIRTQAWHHSRLTAYQRHSMLAVARRDPSWERGEGIERDEDR